MGGRHKSARRLKTLCGWIVAYMSLGGDGEA